MLAPKSKVNMLKCQDIFEHNNPLKFSIDVTQVSVSSGHLLYSYLCFFFLRQLPARLCEEKDK